MRMQVNRATRPEGETGNEKTSDVLRMLKAADGVDVNDGNGPLHVLLDLDPQEASPLREIDNATLITKVRKRCRRAGVRVNLTLQLAPEEKTQDLVTRSVLHATPLRSSRALALRHIMYLFDCAMSEALFLCTPASAKVKGAGRAYSVLGTLCSDLAQLVEGGQLVLVVPPRRQMRLSRAISDASVCSSCLMRFSASPSHSFTMAQAVHNLFLLLTWTAALIADEILVTCGQAMHSNRLRPSVAPICSMFCSHCWLACTLLDCLGSVCKSCSCSDATVCAGTEE
jgi:hypothetical protein